ncbi:ABC transporter ATP-binding protein [Micromonospora sp. M12]
MAAVLQTGGLLKDLTVGETVEMSAHFYRQTRPAAEVLERAGIADIAGRVVGRCSGGQQQRLRFALALLPDPDLMVLDEPTTGMDVEGRRDFWQALRRDARAGRTVIFATHYLDEAEAYADRIVLVRQGASSPTAPRRRSRTWPPAVPCGRPCPARTRPRSPRFRRGRRGGTRRQRAGAHRRLGRDRPAPADPDRRPGRGDHLPQPRGRLPRPDHGTERSLR